MSKRGFRWTIATTAVVLGLVLVWAMFVPVAEWLANHDVGHVDPALHETALDDARSRMLTLGAGLVAAAALVFTARNFTLSREGQVTDRFTKAIEQLGSDKVDVRVGGIYALERIARDSARDHPTIVEVLTAFVREHSREQWPVPEPDGPESEWKARPDILAAVRVIGRRNARRDIGPIDLTGADLRGTNLDGLNLSGAQLGKANLAGTHGWDVNLSHAWLRRANLRQVNFVGADLRGADLYGTDLRKANLGAVDLRGAVIDESNASGARLLMAHLTSDVKDSKELDGVDLRSVLWAEKPPAGLKLKPRNLGALQYPMREDQDPPPEES